MHYTSHRIFRVWSYTASHCFLLLRSPQLFEDVEGYSSETNYNIDIEFWGVGFIELPDMLNGITIYEIRQERPAKFSRYLDISGYRLFAIQSEDYLFYIVAAGCRVGKNNWESSDRISDPTLEYAEILAIL